MEKKKVVIIGAGPAGLTAAYELVTKSDYEVVVYEKDNLVGGISRTVNYKGNRIDIGGHRFFSKSDQIMDWWLKILPVSENSPNAVDITYQNKHKHFSVNKKANENEENVMLIRKRLSRIYFLRSFFDYPISLNKNTIKNLGLKRVFKIGMSYMQARLFPVKNEQSLEDFFINRFGKELYLTFFKDYTEKVWGISCKDISSEWGAQRIKGLNVSKAISHAISSLFQSKKSIRQKNIETSLIEQFLYPKYGPGHLWQEVANKVEEKGGKLFFNSKVLSFSIIDGKINSLKFKTQPEEEAVTIDADYVISTMPVKDLIYGLREYVPENVYEVSDNLVYRDFVTVGLLLKKMNIRSSGKVSTMVPDNWIYIQEKDVLVGRLQIFNNWSPYMVQDSENVWIGLEYFCNEGDDLWNKTEKEFIELAKEELQRIDMIDKADVIDATVIKMEKTYPGYFGSYNRFNEIREYTDKIENLFLIGRNGMHRYNNQDHSMLTAIKAVDHILTGVTDKSGIWEVNTEKEYHETK